jgi:GntR family transcriptional regulator/MocR family aminotransferase
MAAQITAQLRDAVTSGILGAGERLPSTRELAATLGISRTVVTTAYAQLFAEGWLEGRHGAGTFVADVVPGLPLLAAPRAPAPRRRSAGQGPDHAAEIIDLQPGIPWAAGIEPDVWRRAWRRAGTHPPSPWPDPHPPLRPLLARPGCRRRDGAALVSRMAVAACAVAPRRMFATSGMPILT